MKQEIEVSLANTHFDNVIESNTPVYFSTNRFCFLLMASSRNQNEKEEKTKEYKHELSTENALMIIPIISQKNLQGTILSIDMHICIKTHICNKTFPNEHNAETNTQYMHMNVLFVYLCDKVK